jgi:hypothetical protein
VDIVEMLESDVRIVKDDTEVKARGSFSGLYRPCSDERGFHQRSPRITLMLNITHFIICYSQTTLVHTVIQLWLLCD